MNRKNFIFKALMSMMGFVQLGVVGDNSGGLSPEVKPSEADPVKPAEAEPVKPTDPANALSNQEAALLKELMEKKAAAKEMKSLLEQANDKLKAYEGIDVEKVKEIMLAQQKAETKALEEKGEWSRLKEVMATQHGAETAELRAKVEQALLAGQEKDASINALTVGLAFSSSAFIANELTLTPAKAKIIYAPHFDYVDGKVVGYDKPKGSAQRTPLVGSNGEPLSFDEAITKIVQSDPEKDHLIRSKAKPGVGSGTEHVTTGTKKHSVSGMSRIEQSLGKSN